MRTRIRLAVITLFAFATPLAAQQNVGDTIVVKATPLDPNQARQRAVDFVKRTGVAEGQQQVARWVVPVCVKVIGLTTPQAVTIEDLMLDIAYEANMPVAKPGCKPNVTVTFAPDAGQVVRHIYARKPSQLRELGPIEKEQLLKGDAPVRWWYATQPLDREGVPGNNISPGWVSAGANPNAPATTDPITVGGVGDTTSTQQYNSGSHVRTPTIRSLFGATVIIDAPKAGKTPIDALASYAAMIAFAEIKASAPPPDSILGLFQPDRAESALTDWDMAFLKSLYRMPLDRRARIQRGHLVEALLDERLPDKEEKKKP